MAEGCWPSVDHLGQHFSATHHPLRFAKAGLPLCCLGIEVCGRSFGATGSGRSRLWTTANGIPKASSAICAGHTRRSFAWFTPSSEEMHTFAGRRYRLLVFEIGTWIDWCGRSCLESWVSTFGGAGQMPCIVWIWVFTRVLLHRVCSTWWRKAFGGRPMTLDLLWHMWTTRCGAEPTGIYPALA